MFSAQTAAQVDRLFDKQLKRDIYKHCESTYQDRFAELKEFRLDEALNHSPTFETLNDGYEVVSAHHGEIMRCLRNLNDACKGKQYAIDAILTSLSIMQKTLDYAINNVVERELEKP